MHSGSTDCEAASTLFAIYDRDYAALQQLNIAMQHFCSAWASFRTIDLSRNARNVMLMLTKRSFDACRYHEPCRSSTTDAAADTADRCGASTDRCCRGRCGYRASADQTAARPDACINNGCDRGCSNSHYSICSNQETLISVQVLGKSDGVDACGMHVIMHERRWSIDM